MREITDRDISKFMEAGKRLNGIERTVKQRAKQIDQFLEKKAPWKATTKNVIIAATSALAGAATAWVCHEKLPSLNVAAAAAGAVKTAEWFGLDGKGHGMIIGCGGGLGEKWLQKNIPLASLPLPAIGYFDLYQAGLHEGVDSFQEFLASQKKGSGKKDKQKKSRK
jgi:hypothetical protein